jgi:hypothetical protein
MGYYAMVVVVSASDIDMAHEALTEGDPDDVWEFVSEAWEVQTPEEVATLPPTREQGDG